MRRRVAMLVAALVLVLVATAAARAWIAMRLATERVALGQLRQHDKVAGDQRARLAALRAQKAAGDSQLATLRTLLDGSASDTVWLALDDAYNERIWLDALSYARTLRAEAAPQAASQAVSSADATPAALSFQHEVELRGHALDHAALTEFMRAFAERPGIATARLADSGLKQFAALEVVGFGVSATLGPRQRQPQ